MDVGRHERTRAPAGWEECRKGMDLGPQWGYGIGPELGGSLFARQSGREGEKAKNLLDWLPGSLGGTMHAS